MLELAENSPRHMIYQINVLVADEDIVNGVREMATNFLAGLQYGSIYNKQARILFSVAKIQERQEMRIALRNSRKAKGPVAPLHPPPPKKARTDDEASSSHVGPIKALEPNVVKVQDEDEDEKQDDNEHLWQDSVDSAIVPYIAENERQDLAVVLGLDTADGHGPKVPKSLKLKLVRGSYGYWNGTAQARLVVSLMDELDDDGSECLIAISDDIRDQYISSWYEKNTMTIAMSKGITDEERQLFLKNKDVSTGGNIKTHPDKLSWYTWEAVEPKWTWTS